jgi:hypothetical protein
MGEEGKMTWSESVDLAVGVLPALLLTWLITALLLVLGWLSLVEGLQGSDFVLLHIFEVLFQGKGIEDRDLSFWRIIFGMLVILGGVIFWTAAMVAILAKMIAQVVSDHGPSEQATIESPGSPGSPGDPT